MAQACTRVRRMRYIVYGAGAIGGLAGARMAEAGEEVVLIARGDHARAIAGGGLTIESEEGRRAVEVKVATEPADLSIGAGDAVLLGMKSQDAPAALDRLRRVAGPETVVACLQNGVDNERLALRLFAHVYGVHVMCPATHLEPGVVRQESVPIPGMLDVGRYPSGTDGTSATLAAAFRAGGFDSLERLQVMRWKYRKLLMNLSNAVQAVLAPGDEAAEISALAEAEGEACFRAAGIDYATREEDLARRRDILSVKPRTRATGGSSWQSLARGLGSIETDYLNGEIVLLGRLHGVPTPVNALLQTLAWEAALTGARPGSVPVAELRARLGG